VTPNELENTGWMGLWRRTGGIVHRKATNGFRPKWGAQAYAHLQIVIATAKHNGEAVFQALADLM
jgi:hypothetical protein